MDDTQRELHILHMGMAMGAECRLAPTREERRSIVARYRARWDILFPGDPLPRLLADTPPDPASDAP